MENASKNCVTYIVSIVPCVALILSLRFCIQLECPKCEQRQYNWNLYCSISTNCSADVTRDGLEQMEGVFEIRMTV